MAARERAGEMGARQSRCHACGLLSERSSATTRYRRHHVSTSSSEEVGATTGGPARFSYGDGKEEFGEAVVEEVHGGGDVGRSSRRSGDAVNGSNGCPRFGFPHWRRHQMAAPVFYYGAMQITLWILLEIVLQHLTWKPLNNFLLYFLVRKKLILTAP
jgi:hypothetical protein